MVGGSPQTPGLTPGVDVDDADENQFQINRDELVRAAVYGSPTLRVPFALAASIQTDANFLQRLRGVSDWTIGAAGGGSLSNKSIQEDDEDKDDKRVAELEEFFSESDRARHEREEWSKELHSYADIEMTGEEWGEFGDDLAADTPLRRWLIDRMKQDGKTDDQAQAMADKLALIAKSESLPPDQWTDAMKAARKEADDNPSMKTYLNEASQVRQNGATLKTEHSADLSSANRSATDETQSDLFASAPGLTETYGKAVAAVEPLDMPKLQQPASAPLAPANAGLDV